MKKLDRYISVNFIKSISLTLFAFVNIFILAQLFKIIRYVTSGRLTPIEGVYYGGALLPEMVVRIAPLAILLGGLMTTNKMASSLEIIAMKTSGISLKRVLKYPLIIAFIFSLGVYYVNDRVYPKTNEYAMKLKRKNSMDNKKVPLTKDHAYLKGDGTYLYYFGFINREDNTGKNIQVIELDENFEKIEKIINAKTGVWDKEKKYWVLSDVSVIDVKANKEFKEKTYENEKFVEKPEIFMIPSIEHEFLNFAELKKAIALMKRTGGNALDAELELHSRRAYSFAPYIISFLGLALGSRYVRGASAISIATAVAFGFLYFIVQSAFEALASGGLLPPVIGAWIPNILFFTIGRISLNKAEY